MWLVVGRTGWWLVISRNSGTHLTLQMVWPGWDKVSFMSWMSIRTKVYWISLLNIDHSQPITVAELCRDNGRYSPWVWRVQLHRPTSLSSRRVNWDINIENTSLNGLVGTPALQLFYIFKLATQTEPALPLLFLHQFLPPLKFMSRVPTRVCKPVTCRGQGALVWPLENKVPRLGLGSLFSLLQQ